MDRQTYLELRKAMSNRSWAEVDAILQKWEKGPDDRRYDDEKARLIAAYPGRPLPPPADLWNRGGK